MRVCGGVGNGVCFSLFMVSVCFWRGRLCFGRGRDGGFVLYISLFLRVLGWGVCVCLWTLVHTHQLLGYLMWAQVWDGHLESRKNPDRLKRSINVDRIGVHSTFVYTYAGLRALMIWANCLFFFNMSFFLRKVEDVTTISKSQSITSVSIKDCFLRVPNETTTLFLLWVIIKAIYMYFAFTAYISTCDSRCGQSVTIDNGSKLARHINPQTQTFCIFCQRPTADGLYFHMQTLWCSVARQTRAFRYLQEY